MFYFVSTRYVRDFSFLISLNHFPSGFFDKNALNFCTLINVTTNIDDIKASLFNHLGQIISLKNFVGSLEP